MKMRKFLQNKLWRDKAPGMMEAIGSIVHIKDLTDAEYDIELRTKLLEEAAEVQAAKSQEEIMNELADVYEVVDSLIKLHNLDKEAISVIQTQKRERRGGFEQRKFVTIAEHPEGGYGEAYCLADPLKYPEVIE
jgi:predicted house-cleaning noncanonical NTP pyrophosphatase (MazG superfamily)